jgi:hypothetical protein
VVDVEHRQLMLQAVLALAQRVDPAADRGHALAQVQIEPLYKPTVSPDVISLVAGSCEYYRGQIEQGAAH